MTTPHTPLLQNCPRTLSAIAAPILGSVPEPNSSIRMREEALALRSICFMLTRCPEYVERSSAMLCSSPISIIMLMKMPERERSLTGIDSPHCSIYCRRPVVFRHTDFPPALGPEMTSRRRSVVSEMSNGTMVFGGVWSSGTRSAQCLSSDISSSG